MDTTITDAFALAVGHHQDGQLEAAADIYRLIIEVLPGHAAALNNLGLMVPPVAAAALFRQAIAAEPNYVDALINLSSALLAAGEPEEAARALDRAVSLIPDEPQSLFQLAHLLHTQGRVTEAAVHYERAIQLQPDFSAALCNLGTLHNAADRTEAAADCYGRALALDPDLEVANLNMVAILEADGRLEEAKLCRNRLLRPHALEVDHSPEHRRTVLVLGNACAGNLPLDTILPKRTNTRITWHADFATDEQEGALPPYDVAFNAIGNADLLDEAYGCVSRFAASHKLLNHPDAVAQTRRDRLPALLNGIPGLIVPRIVRLTRSQMASGSLPSVLDAAGISCPVLIRPIAGHGGEGVHLVETAEDLARHRPGAADAYYVIAYRDVRQADGFHRKYRTVFIDRKPYPYHLAISDHWLVHYFSAAMMSAPWKREEEQRFLEDPLSALGRTAMAAIQALGERLDLDFAAADFAILPDGQLLLFEANATMLVHLRDSPIDFPYKHAHIPPIFTAVEALLDRHTALPRTTTALPQGLACRPPLP